MIRSPSGSRFLSRAVASVSVVLRRDGLLMLSCVFFLDGLSTPALVSPEVDILRPGVPSLPDALRDGLRVDSRVDLRDALGLRVALRAEGLRTPPLRLDLREGGLSTAESCVACRDGATGLGGAYEMVLGRLSPSRLSSRVVSRDSASLSIVLRRDRTGTAVIVVPGARRSSLRVSCSGSRGVWRHSLSSSMSMRFEELQSAGCTPGPSIPPHTPTFRVASGDLGGAAGRRPSRE